MASAFERALKNTYESWRIQRHYGVRYPQVVQPPLGTVWLHIDPVDERARKMITAAAVRGKTKVNQTFWAGAIQFFQPTVAIDVGVNFGECLLAHEYPAGVALHGFEANPRLGRFLERTIATHPNRSQIRLHLCAAGESSSSSVEFFIDRRWSGGSGLSINADRGSAAGYDRIAVPVERIDNLVARPERADRLLFKVDVEGHEPAVIRGMSGTVGASDSALGLLEFDVDYMTKQHFDLDAYWQLLSGIGDVYQVQRRALNGPLPATWPEAKRALGSRTHFDVLIARNGPTRGELCRICFFPCRTTARCA